MTDEGVDAVERATWRLAGARDKLRAITSLALGVPALRLDRPGVRFAPDHRKIARHLKEIGSGDALRLRELFDQIAEHPAIALRNQINHSLAPLPEVAEVCWIDVAILDDDNDIIDWDTSKRLFPENMLEQGSLEPQTIYDFATTAIEDAHTLIGQAISAAAATAGGHSTGDRTTDCRFYGSGVSCLPLPTIVRLATASPRPAGRAARRHHLADRFPSCFQTRAC